MIIYYHSTDTSGAVKHALSFICFCIAIDQNHVHVIVVHVLVQQSVNVHQYFSATLTWFRDNVCHFTFVGASDEAGSHADLLVPVDGMEANVASDEGFVQVVNTLQVTINVTAELLHKQIISTI